MCLEGDVVFDDISVFKVNDVQYDVCKRVFLCVCVFGCKRVLCVFVCMYEFVYED